MLTLLQLSCTSAMVRSTPCTRHLCCSFYTHRHCHGYHESALLNLSHLSTRLRSSLSWSTSCEHGFRDIRLHLFSSRHQVFCRPQTRPLHEDSTSNTLPRPNGSHHNIKLYSNRRTQLDVRQRLWDLHYTSSKRLRLPPRTCPLQRLHSLGRRRPRRILRTKRHLSFPSMVFPLWRHNTNHPLALRTQPQEKHRSKDQPPRPLRLVVMDPTRYRTELLCLGSGVFCV